MTDYAAQMQRVTVRFGDTVALDAVDLEVRQGTILGLLGPNGSGKTTAVKVLATLQRHDEGTAAVFGLDVRDEAAAVRERIALAGQYAAVDDLLSGHQNLTMFGQLLGLGRRDARRKADELLERFELSDAAHRRVRGYSGGMRRRLDLASSLVTDPDLLFLDEPTTGLDLRSRRTIWQVVRQLRDAGSTILLTTQYLEEAERLADEITVLDRGQVIATGSLADLKEDIGGLRLEVVVRGAGTTVVDVLRRTLPGAVHTDDGGRIVACVDERPLATVAAAANALADAAVDVTSLALRGPDLDDVFLELTGDSAAAGGPRDGTR